MFAALFCLVGILTLRFHYAARCLKYLSRAPSQMLSASAIEISMTLCPSIETLIRSVPVVPISRAGTPVALARSISAPMCSRATETMTRDADSENNVAADVHAAASTRGTSTRSEEHTSELQSQ